jgi:Kef-type K+ transport system membrane component KefB
LAIFKPLGDHELFLLLVQFALLLVTARLLGEGAKKLGLPSVVGELLAGFVLGPTLLGNVAPGLFRATFPQEAGQVHLLEVVAWLGVIMLLILTGLETDMGLIARKGRGAAAISLGGIAVPFLSGLALGLVVPAEFLAAPDKRLVFALFIGTAMSISAIPVIAKVLMEMHVIRRDIGQITLAAGMIDDTIGWVLLSVVAGLASSGNVNPLTAGRSLLAVVVVLGAAYTVGRRAVGWLIRTLDNQVGGDMVKITAVMALALVFGAVTQQLRLEAVLGAFIAGCWWAKSSGSTNDCATSSNRSRWVSLPPSSSPRPACGSTWPSSSSPRCWPSGWPCWPSPSPASSRVRTPGPGPAGWGTGNPCRSAPG